MTKRDALKLPDLFSAVFALLFVYFLLTGRINASLGALIGAAYSWACTRKETPRIVLRRIAGAIDAYALNAVIILIVAGALAGFGQQFARVDFGVFYSSALIMRTCPENLYDLQLQADVLRQVSGIAEHHYLNYPYPPFVALLFIPLTYFSFKTAYTIMLICNLGLCALTVFLLANRLRYNKRQSEVFILCTAAALPVYATLVLGHLSFVGMLLFSLVCVDWLDGRHVRVGLWTGLLGYKVSLLAVPLGFLVWRRRWRGVAVAFSVLGAMIALSLELVGSQGFMSNLNVLWVATSDSMLPRTQSMRALTYLLGLGEGGWMALSLAMLSTLCWAFSRLRDERWGLAAMVLAALAVSPYVQTYDLVIGLVPFALAISTDSQIAARTQKLYVLVAFVPVCLSILSQTSGRPVPIVPISMAAGFCYCVFRAVGHPRSQIDKCATPLGS